MRGQRPGEQAMTPPSLIAATTGRASTSFWVVLLVSTMPPKICAFIADDERCRMSQDDWIHIIRLGAGYKLGMPRQHVHGAGNNNATLDVQQNWNVQFTPLKLPSASITGWLSCRRSSSCLIGLAAHLYHIPQVQRYSPTRRGNKTRIIFLRLLG